jgi:hypothetical protein
VIIDDLDAVRIAFGPSKADTPLVVDPNAVLSRSIAVEFLKTIPRRHAKVIEPHRGIHLGQLAQHDPA